MKTIKYLMLVAISLSAACRPATLPETTQGNSQILSTPTHLPTSLATEEQIVDIAQNSPLATPTNSVTEISQISPVSTPPPKHATAEDTTKETDKANVANDVAIIFHRSGGLAGVDEQWIIYTDGRIDEPDGEQRQVEPKQVLALLETIRVAGFFDFNDSYVPLDTCCDRFTYTITVQFDGQTKTVGTLDASPTQPDQLTTVIDAIGELLFTSE